MLNHHQLEITFGILGNVVSFFVFLAPVPTFYRIFKKKSTEGFHSLPYLVALFSCMLWLWYADIKGNSLALITINSFGCIVEILYIVMYLVYAPRATRNGTLTLLITMDIGLFSLIVLATDYFTTGGERIVVAGWICVGISVSVFAAPLSIMARVIRTRSVEFMPFYLSFSLTVSAIMWLGYGVFKKDLCVSIPNIAGFALGFAQMVLYGKYRNAEKVIIIDEKLPERIKDVVILPLGIVEIHPVEVKVTVKGEIRAEEEPKNGDNNNGRAGKDNEQTVKVPDVEAGVK